MSTRLYFYSYERNNLKKQIFFLITCQKKNVFKNVKNWEGERKKEHKTGGGSETIVLWISLVSLFIWQIQNSFHIASKYFNTGNKIFLIFLICKICQRLRSDNSYITISPQKKDQLFVNRFMSSLHIIWRRKNC